MSSVDKVMANTDWVLLAKQREGLAEQIDRLNGEVAQLRHLYGSPNDAAEVEARAEHLGNILGWMDFIITAARADGYPVPEATE